MLHSNLSSTRKTNSSSKIASVFLSVLYAFITLLMLFSALGVQAAPSATHTVTKSADTNDGVCNSDCSLREAINQANSGDLIIFHTSLAGQTINLSAIGQLVINKALTIDGSSLTSHPILSGGDITRVMYLDSSADVTLIGLTIRDGNTPDGIDAPAVISTEVNGNPGMDAVSGGGIYINGGTLLISKTLITQNTTGNGGQGGDSLSKIGTVITDGTYVGGAGGDGGNGGGVYNNGGQLTIFNSTIESNTTGVGGMGGNGGELSDLGRSSGRGGTGGAGGGGAGIYSISGTVTIESSGFYTNTTGAGGIGGDSGDINNAAGKGSDVYAGTGGTGGNGGYGAAIYTTADDTPGSTHTLSITDSTFSGNATGASGMGGNGGNIIGHAGGAGRNWAGRAGDTDRGGYGGAIYNSNHSLNMTHSQFLNNKAGDALLNGLPGASVAPNGIDGSTFNSGRGGHGGAIYSSSSITGHNVILENLTISNNHAGSGGSFGGDAGGAYIEVGNSSILIKNSIFSNNLCGSGSTPFRGAEGGGLYLESDASDTTVTGGQFNNNACGLGGGATFYPSDGTFTITHNTVYSNTGDGGGGIYTEIDESIGTVAYNVFLLNLVRDTGNGGGVYIASSSSNLTVEQNTMTNNQARNGGGIYIESEETTYTIQANVVYSNTARRQGGGIDIENDSGIAIDRLIMQGNSAPSGGAIYLNSESVLTVTNSLLTGNIATTTHGGAVASEIDSILTLINSTLSGNRVVTGSGGGVYSDEGNVNLINTIVWNNQDQSGVGTLSASISTTTNMLTSTHSTLQGSGGSSNWHPNAGVDQGGNVDVDPLFADPVGPAAAPFVAGNFSLKPLSPMINTGSTAAYNNLTTNMSDLAGNGRIFESIIDMGAYEFTRFNLAVLFAGTGSGQIAGLSANCTTDCSEMFVDNTTVTLTPTADSGSTFTGWTGDCAANANSTADCTITIDAAKNVTATFELDTQQEVVIFLPIIMK